MTVKIKLPDFSKLIYLCSQNSFFTPVRETGKAKLVQETLNKNGMDLRKLSLTYNAPPLIEDTIDLTTEIKPNS